MSALFRFNCPGRLVEAVAGEHWPEHGESFLLLDGARIPKLSAWLRRRSEGTEWVSLLGANTSAAMLDVSPVLVRQPAHCCDLFLFHLLNDPIHTRSISVLVSRLSLSALAKHLADHVYVENPDATRWGLAFWDPFVLTSLVGASPAASALVPGPVLSPSQCASLLAPVAFWCYRGRDDEPQVILPPAATDGAPARVPFTLEQGQMDQLADISLPDQVLNVLLDSMPRLAAAHDHAALHRHCCEAIKARRQRGENSLSNYCSAVAETLACGTGSESACSPDC